MKQPFSKNKLIAIIGIIVGIGITVLVIQWLLSGGWPATGPTGDTLPPHIQQVDPADGKSVSEIYSYCAEFHFQTDRGMKDNPTSSIRFFLDGVDVTSKMDGLVTLDYPPSLGTLCYKPGKPLPTGWHTAKISYRDSDNTSFSYMWRFQVIGK